MISQTSWPYERFMKLSFRPKIDASKVGMVRLSTTSGGESSVNFITGLRVVGHLFRPYFPDPMRQHGRRYKDPQNHDNGSKTVHGPDKAEKVASDDEHD